MNFHEPVSGTIIIGAIILIFMLIVVGLGIVRYFKNKQLGE